MKLPPPRQRRIPERETTVKLRLSKSRFFFWEPRDIWIGLYWKRWPQALELYACLVPCFPIYFYWQWEKQP